jgi:CheY-like chemotaxis protein
MLDALEGKDADEIGTVLYFTLPVYEDSEGAFQALQKNSTSVGERVVITKSEYIFRPFPAGYSSGGCFKILVADDVLMLRKGMAHAIEKLWSSNFPECPVSITTSCSAEDVIRVLETEPFDLVICDHHFVLDESLRGDDGAVRPKLLINNTLMYNPDCHPNDSKIFFEKERFTVKEGDGQMLGLNALIQVSSSNSLNFPRPLLMLVSGHTFDVDPGLGIIVALKPLKPSEIIGKLESHVSDLRQANGFVREVGGGTLVNGRGSQLFVRVNANKKAKTKHVRRTTAPTFATTQAAPKPNESDASWQDKQKSSQIS